MVGRIRALAARRNGLFRMHIAQPVLYARARRLFGSWAAAVSAAGLDHPGIVRNARQRALAARRSRRRRERLSLRERDGTTDGRSA